MNLFKSFIFLSLIAVYSTSLAQRPKEYAKVADQAFKLQQYSIAIDKYKKAYSKIREKNEKNRISFQIAECYRLTNNFKRSEAAYKRLIQIQYYKTNPLVYLYYANSLKENQNYEEATVQYTNYKNLVPTDPRADIGIESCALAQKWNENLTRYTVQNQKELNTKSNEWAPNFADKKKFRYVVFTSSRENSTGKAIDGWTGQDFSDLYISKQDRKGAWSAPDLLDESTIVNTIANEGEGYVNSKGNTLYFTRCGVEKKKQMGCQIYVSAKTGNGWEQPKILKLTPDSVSDAMHPTLSDDELTIYFTSNMPGGQGKYDIWTANRKSKSEPFGTAINLGQHVNTPENEAFPYLRFDTVLYFSSNGLISMGGYDIYKIYKEDDKWSSPENMKAPINSNGDDISVTFYGKEEKGFFSSNRKGGKGGDDIYFFSAPPLTYTLKGIVKDDNTLQPLAEATITMVGSDGSVIEAKTDEKGTYSFNKTQISPQTTYDLAVAKKKYFSTKGKFTTIGLENNKDFVQDFNLAPIPKESIVLPDILYDLAKWDLKPQYQDSLMGLIQTLQVNPTIVIELASHTDSRDSYENNDVLSQKRAQSVVDYLISRGIASDRLVAKGYGERAPRLLDENMTVNGVTFKSETLLSEDFINSLKTDPEKEAAHQLNRRTEFKVLRDDYVPKALPNENKVAPATEIQVITAPSQNAVAYTVSTNNILLIPCVVNGRSFQFTIDYKVADDIRFSLASAMTLLKEGRISKSDFMARDKAIASDGSIIENSLLILKTITIGETTLNNIQVTVISNLSTDIVIGSSALSQFGNYKLDKENKELIFK